jgi:hypothetical protein
MEQMLAGAASGELENTKSKGTARRFDKSKARKKSKLAKKARKKARKKR